MGADAYIHMPTGLAMWHEMELLVEAAVPPAAILKGATINTAEFVHQEKNLGTIEAGKQATSSSSGEYRWAFDRVCAWCKRIRDDDGHWGSHRGHNPGISVA